jgi:hypothetical protein
MIELLLSTFILPSLLVYLLIKPLRGEPYISICPDVVFVMTLIYPVGFACILIRCLANFRFLYSGRNEYVSGAKIINFPKLRDI